MDMNSLSILVIRREVESAPVEPEPFVDLPVIKHPVNQVSQFQLAQPVIVVLVNEFFVFTKVHGRLFNSFSVKRKIEIKRFS